MAQVDRIVQVNISRQTQQIDIASFDIPLILVRVDEAEVSMPNRVETFTGLEAVGDMFGVNHNAYRMASKLLSGALRPARFKIAKARSNSSPISGIATGVVVGEVVEDPITFAVITQPDNGTVSVDVDGEYTYTGDVGFSGSDSFEVEIEDADAVTETVTITVTVSGAMTPETYVAALQETLVADNEWYALLSDARFDQDLLALANAIQAQRKVYFTSSQDINITSSESVSDVGYLMYQGTLSRTALTYSASADADYPEAAWVGSQLIEAPGSNTWAFKTLEGVNVSPLSDSQINALESKNVNYYTRILGAAITQTGAMASGEWIDTIIFVDWLHARIQEAVFYRMINRKKIPFTRAGATLIEAEIRAVLAAGVAVGGIADDTPFVVISPDPLQIPESQRATRVMGDFRFEARLAGAVHRVIIRGVVSY